MENYYEILGVAQAAPVAEIKKAFREKAKKLHPDIAGREAEEAMRRLLRAWEVLSNVDRREEYDRAYGRFVGSGLDFNYRTFLKESPDDPAAMAKLIFFDFLHLEEDEAVAIWDRMGGLDYELEEYLDREDWMDCAFILAEELDKRGKTWEAFELLVDLVREERRKPYFKHFAEEIDDLIREILRLRLLPSVGDELFIDCLEEVLDLGYSGRDEGRWLRAMAESLERLGERDAAREALTAAKQRDSSLSIPSGLRRRVGLL